MVFINEQWNNTGDIVIYSNYHKYWLDRERKIKNPLFDVFSGKILDLKEGKQSAINYFYNILTKKYAMECWLLRQNVKVVRCTQSSMQNSNIADLRVTVMLCLPLKRRLEINIFRKTAEHKLLITPMI